MPTPAWVDEATPLIITAGKVTVPVKVGPAKILTPPTVGALVDSISVNQPLVTLAPVAAKEPVRVMLLVPKATAPVSELMVPNLTMPVEEAVAKARLPEAVKLVTPVMAPVIVAAPEANVPVVVRFSSPKLIVPVSELMVADFRTALPVVEALPANETAPVKADVPVTASVLVAVKAPPMEVAP